MSRQRLHWSQVPTEFVHAVESVLGTKVTHVDNIPSGFSPGPAGPCQLADGRRVFLKACGSNLNPDTPEMLRAEARVLAGLSPSVRAPHLIASVDDGDWVAVVTEFVDGVAPQPPLSAGDISVILELVQHLADHPGNEVATGSHLRPLGQAGGRFEMLHWSPARHMAERLPSWTHDHLDELIEIEQSWASAAAGDHLVHLDLRADNIVIGPSSAWVVDWAAACRAAVWVDLVGLLPSLHLDGAASPAEIFAHHPVGRAAPSEAVTAFLVHLTGYFLHSSLLVEPPGLTGLRAFQRAQGEVALNWLITRWPR
jgi:hypothetical protein